MRLLKEEKVVVKGSSDVKGGACSLQSGMCVDVRERRGRELREEEVD